MKKKLQNISYFAEFTLEGSEDIYRFVGCVDKTIKGARHEAVYNRTKYLEKPKYYDDNPDSDELITWLNWETEVTVVRTSYLNEQIR